MPFRTIYRGRSSKINGVCKNTKYRSLLTRHVNAYPRLCSPSLGRFETIASCYSVLPRDLNKKIPQGRSQLSEILRPVNWTDNRIKEGKGLSTRGWMNRAVWWPAPIILGMVGEGERDQELKVILSYTAIPGYAGTQEMCVRACVWRRKEEKDG